MLRQINQRAIFFFILAIGALIILASGISNILFVPEPFAVEPGAQERPLTPWITLGSVENKFLFLIFFVLLILAFIAVLLAPEGRILLLRSILLIGAFILLSRLLLPRDPAQGLQAGAPETEESVDDGEIQPLIPSQSDLNLNPETPSWLVTVIGINLALLIVGGSAAIFWLIARQRSFTSVPQEISLEARTAIQALDAGGNFEDVILRCYARMSQVLSEQRGLDRESSMTPHEFERVLIRLGFPSQPVRALTHLFEEVRYGNIQQGEKGIQLAVSSLNAIILYCKSLEQT